MFKRILFPTDFSKDRNMALSQAFQALNFDEREVIVLHVVNNFFGQHAHWASLFDVHQLQKEMDFHVETEIRDALRDDMKQATSFRPIISQGKPPEEICRMAHKELVDLVVMGSTRGVTTMRVVRSSTRPVLAIPVHPVGSKSEDLLKRRETPPHFGHSASILVATDFSRQSKKVTDYAFRDQEGLRPADSSCLRRQDTHHAAQSVAARPDRIFPGRTPQVGQAPGTKCDFPMNSYRTNPSMSGLNWVPRATASLTPRKQIEPTMIVMGAKGYGPVEQHFYGTTVDKVLRSAHQPVLTLTI